MELLAYRPVMLCLPLPREVTKETEDLPRLVISPTKDLGEILKPKKLVIYDPHKKRGKNLYKMQLRHIRRLLH